MTFLVTGNHWREHISRMPAMSHSTGDKYDQTNISKLEAVNYYAKPCMFRRRPANPTSNPLFDPSTGRAMPTSPHFRNHQLTIKIDTDPGGQFMMNVEDAILRMLGNHPRIITYHGKDDITGALILDTAPNGDVQFSFPSYSHSSPSPPSLRHPHPHLNTRRSTQPPSTVALGDPHIDGQLCGGSGV
jgi:hypothetical protein